MENEKDCIVLFSGGRDSWLSTCKLIEGGFRVHLVYFNNGTGLASDNVNHSIQRLRDSYGDRIEPIGIINISGIWREFFLPYMNLTPSEIVKEWGEITTSQFNCLTCRSAMYVWTILKCLGSNIHYVAEGARQVQNWAIMQPSMIERFKHVLSEYSVELLLPVYDLQSDWHRKNMMLMRGFVPKTLEPQCLVGIPLPGDTPMPESIQKAVETCFDNFVLPRMRELITDQKAAIQSPSFGKGQMI